MIESLSLRRSMYAALYTQQKNVEKEPEVAEQKKAGVQNAPIKAEKEPDTTEQIRARLAQAIEMMKAEDPEGFEEKSMIKGTREYRWLHMDVSRIASIKKIDPAVALDQYRKNMI